MFEVRSLYVHEALPCLQFSHARLGLACMIDNRFTSLSIRVVDRYACLRRPLRRTRWCSKEVRGRGHGLTRSRTSWTLRLCQIKRCTKTYSMLVCKAQDIGIELTFLTVEGLPEPKNCRPFVAQMSRIARYTRIISFLT